MASKHLDGLLQVAVPSREEAAALGRVDIRKDWRQRVVAHKGLAHAHRVRMPSIVIGPLVRGTTFIGVYKGVTRGLFVITYQGNTGRT